MAGVRTLQREIGILFITPVVGGLIGWITNVIAIKMLFHPRKPIQIPLTPWKIHGLLPKRKADIARSVAAAVANELVTIDNLLDQIDSPKLKENIVRAVISHVDQRLVETLPQFIPSNLRYIIRKYVSDLITKEAELLLESMMDSVKSKVAEEVHIAAIVEEQILSFDMVRLENLVIGIAKTELKAIEVLGGVLGFLIGIFQAVLVLLLA